MADSNLPTRWSRSGNGSDDRVRESYGYPERPDFGEETSLLRLVLDALAVMRRNWLLVFVTTAAAVGVMIYRAKQERPMFQSTAVVRITDRSPLKEGNSPAANIVVGPGLLSQIQILQSHGIATEIAQREGLRLRPNTRDLPPGLLKDVQVAPAAKDGAITLKFLSRQVEASGWGKRVRSDYGSPIELDGARFTVAWRPELETGELLVVPLETAANELVGRLRANQRSNTELIDVMYQDGDEYRAQRVVNTAVEVFQSADALAAKQASIRRREFIEQQLRKTEVLLNEAEMAQNRLRSQQQVERVQGRGPVQPTDVAVLASRRDELELQRAPLKAFLDSNTTSLTSGARDHLAAIVASLPPTSPVAQSYTQLTRLQANRDSLTVGLFARSSRDPDVRRLDILILSTDSAVMRGLHTELSFIDTRLSALDEMKQRAIQEISSLPASQIQESDITTQVDSYRRQADALRAQLQAAQIDEAAEAGQVEIVDRATGRASRIGSGRAPKFAAALIIGLMLGTALGYVLENHRPVIRRREDLERTAAIPNLAFVPQIPPMSRRFVPRFLDRRKDAGGVLTERELVIVSNSRSTGAEAYRTLRTNLLFSSANDVLKRLVITSAGPKEGKSTTAANLAIAFAQQGRRVLIVDCDLRRPRMHKIFRRPLQPGLADLLSGKSSGDLPIARAPVEGLYVLTAGTLPSNPAELLGSQAMGALLDRLSDGFDVVVMDTPPLLATSDAAVLGRRADGTLIVVRGGQTQPTAVTESIQQLENVGARVLGTVLNDPDAEVAKFAPYYHYYYNNYYDYSKNE